MRPKDLITMLGIMSMDAYRIGDDIIQLVGGKDDFRFYEETVMPLISLVFGVNAELSEREPRKEPKPVPDKTKRPLIFMRDCRDISGYLDDEGVYNIKEAVCFRPKNRLHDNIKCKMKNIYRRNRDTKTYLLNRPMNYTEMKWYFEAIMASRATVIGGRTPRMNISVGEENELMFYNLFLYAKKMGFKLNGMMDLTKEFNGTESTSHRITFILADTRKFFREFETLNPRFYRIDPYKR